MLEDPELIHAAPEKEPFLLGFPATFAWFAPYLMGAQVQVAGREGPTLPRLRYIIVAIGTLAASIGISCSFAYNFAVVCNVNASMDSREVYEMSPRNSPIMYFPPSISNMIYSSFPSGNILTLFALLALRGRVSMRTQVLVGSFISTIATALIPMLYDIWPTSTLVLKLIQGAAVAPTIPLIGHVASHWAPLAEVGFIVAILSSYSQLGIFITMATSGVICEQFGWRSIFYFNAMLSGAVLILWIVLFRDRPSQHPWLSLEEYQLIRKHEETEEQKERPPVPYRKFFSNSSVWAVLIATFGNYNGVTPLIVFSAAILKKAVGLTDMQTANYNAASFFMQLVLKLASGIISDRWMIDETNKTRIFNTISCGLSGLLMVATAFLPVEKQILCAVLITISQGVIGFNSAGFNKAAMVVTRQYAHFILTLIGVIISASTIFEPFLVWAIAPDTTWEQWKPLLIAHGSLLFVSNIAYCIIIRAIPAPFTRQLDVSTVGTDATTAS